MNIQVTGIEKGAKIQGKIGNIVTAGFVFDQGEEKLEQLLGKGFHDALEKSVQRAVDFADKETEAPPTDVTTAVTVEEEN